MRASREPPPERKHVIGTGFIGIGTAVAVSTSPPMADVPMNVGGGLFTAGVGYNPPNLSKCCGLQSSLTSSSNFISFKDFMFIIWTTLVTDSRPPKCSHLDSRQNYAT